jgi:uncharacterized protein YndB with AHSA1/START domain
VESGKYAARDKESAMGTRAPVWTVTIDAAPDKIWPYIGDMAKHDDWSPKPFKIEWESGQPNAVGSTFKSSGELPQDKNHSMEGIIVSSEAPKKLVVKSSDKTGQFTNTLELTPEGGKTKVTRTVEFPPAKGVYVVLIPILMPTVIRPGVQKGLNMLKTKVEDGA